jgi:hypothetical protein
LPTPLSPVINTFASLEATRSTDVNNCRICSLVLTTAGRAGPRVEVVLGGRVCILGPQLAARPVSSSERLLKARVLPG